VSRETIETLRRAYEGFGRMDVPAILSVLNEDVKWDATDAFAHRGLFRGHAGVKEYLQSLSEVWEQFELEPDEFIESSDGKQMMVLGEIRGRLRATGEGVKARFAHVGRLEQGKVVVMKICLDREGAERFMEG
jgi:ketosteroid isomerase-like protein